MKSITKSTRDDVARLAGVAPSTVSNVINNKGSVNETLRNKVLKAIKELNYTPNLVARSLMTKSSKQIGLVMDEITNPHFAEMAKGVQFEASLNGYLLSISLATKDIDRTVEDYLSRQVDGIIFNAYANFMSTRVNDKLDQSGTAYVCCGGLKDPRYNFIGINYYNGMKKAYTYLVQLGHTKIAYISGLIHDMINNEYIDRRAVAFKWCCETIGNGFNERDIVFGLPPYDTDYRAGYRYCNMLLDRKSDYTAIIVVNDYMALGVLQALRENGIKVPQDISVLSFDNTIYAETSYPRLTSMESPAFKVGQKAVQCIIEMNRSSNIISNKIEEWFDMEIVVRESTAVNK